MNIINIYKKTKGNKTLVNGGLFSLYSFIGKGISFLILMLLAKYISPEEYGYLNLFTTIISFVTIFMALSTNGYVSISYFRKEETNFKKDFTSIYLIGLATFLFLVVIVVIGGKWIGAALKLSSELMLIAVAISFFTFSFLLQQDVLRIKEKIGEYGVYNVLNALLNLILTFLFIAKFQQGWMGRVNAQLLCTVAFGLVSLLFFFRHNLFKVDLSKKRYNEIISWGLPMIPHHATGWLRQGLDRYIINYYYTVYDVGVFSFALNASNVIEMIGMAFNATNSITIFQTLSRKELSKDERHHIIRLQTRNIILVYVVVSIGIVLLLTPLAYYLMPQYRASIPYLLILSVAGFLKCMYFLYCNYLFYFSETKHLMYITFGTSVFHVILSLLLTRYSLYLTATVYVIIQFVILYFVIHESKKLLERNLIKAAS